MYFLMNFIYVFVFCVNLVYSGAPIVTTDSSRPQHRNFENEGKIHQHEISKTAKVKDDYVCKNHQYCGCVINGKDPRNYNIPVPDTENQDNFFKAVTLPICGNPFFDMIKRCSLAHYFNDTHPDYMPKDDKGKMILVLLDGCATCKKGGKITGLRVTHRDEDGGFFSQCSDVEEYEAFRVSELNIKVDYLSIDIPFQKLYVFKM
uniref:Uncharacterized protein n=1 Tax=Meloidogyne incognita TaxID=6306 RepID=A0A914L1D8_MELIC